MNLKEIKASEIPETYEPTNSKTFTTREFARALAKFPEAKELELGFFDNHGFDTMLTAEWIYLVENTAYLTFTSRVSPIGLKRIDFKKMRISKQIKVLGKPISQLIKDLEVLPDVEIFMTNKRNISRFGLHDIMPLNLVGPSTYSTYEDGHEKSFRIDLDSILVAYDSSLEKKEE
jgi:hypothetical protein